MDFNRISQEERESIYNEVWTDPVTTVAQRYNMSDNGLRKHCRKLWIPLPPAGYWAKIKAGKTVYKPELPTVRGELKKFVHGYAIKFRTNIDKLSDDELMGAGPLCMLTEETITLINETCSQVRVKGQLRNPHSLIEQHKEESAYRKNRDKALQKARFNSDYYSITKNKYRDNKAMLPIFVSDRNLNRAYRIMNTLFGVLEDFEGKISLYSNPERDQAYFFIMHDGFFFEMKEEKERKKRTENNEESSPRLILLMYVEDWYERNIKVSLEYKDKAGEPLEEQVGEIILDICYSANKLMVQEELDKRKEKREEEEKERKRRLELMRKGELEEIKLLQQAANDWDQAQRIRSFIDTLEIKINELEDDKDREKLFEWIKWARGKADWLDPLIAKEDKLLGKNKHLFGQILEN